MVQLGQMLRIGTVLAHPRRADEQVMAAEQPPHASQRVVLQHWKGRAHASQGPAARWRAVRGRSQFLPRLLPRRMLQALDQLVTPVKDRPDVSRRAETSRHCGYRGAHTN